MIIPAAANSIFEATGGIELQGPIEVSLLDERGVETQCDRQNAGGEVQRFDAAVCRFKDDVGFRGNCRVKDVGVIADHSVTQVITLASDKDVVAVAAHQCVVPGAADQFIAAIASLEDIVQRISSEPISVAAADDVFNSVAGIELQCAEAVDVLDCAGADVYLDGRMQCVEIESVDAIVPIFGDEVGFSGVGVCKQVGVVACGSGETIVTGAASESVGQ